VHVGRINFLSETLKEVRVIDGRLYDARVKRSQRRCGIGLITW
jgi:hypothetical protein